MRGSFYVTFAFMGGGMYESVGKRLKQSGQWTRSKTRLALMMARFVHKARVTLKIPYSSCRTDTLRMTSHVDYLLGNQTSQYCF